MFPFWKTTIAPLLEAAGVRRLVEIGALRGENTRQIIEHLGPDTELHVIDPVPGFDPEEHVARFGGQYVFHRDLSINVLGQLPPMDAALIDGDHNWYTVYNELRLLREVATTNGAPLPLLILHDVGWPYGRRDLYYNPDDVPDEFRQPWRNAGIKPGGEKLAAQGGLNPNLCNAETEGGPRNGVMTALEDFLAEHDRQYRLEVIPIYFGLAIVAEHDLLERRPALVAALDRLAGLEGKDDLLRLAEDVRLRSMLSQRNVSLQQNEKLDRATSKYLRTVKASLLNEHYLDHELRFQHLTERQRAGTKPEPHMLRDPVRHDQRSYSALVRQRLGPAGPDPSTASFLPYTDMGRTRLDHVEHCLDAVRHDDVPGDLVECGTGRGGGAIFMRAWLDAHEIDDRRVWVADHFRSSPEPQKAPILPSDGVAGFQADLNLVRDGFERFALLDDRVRFLVGSAAETLPGAPLEQVAMIRIGRGIGAEAREVLKCLYHRLAPGGFVVIDDAHDSDAQRATDAFRAEQDITDQIIHVGAHVRAWRKPQLGSEARRLPEPRSATALLPVTDDGEEPSIDLTVVVVFYNMRREAERTLRSLSRSYQEGVEDLSYEVIVVDNGSSPDQRLDEAFVAAFGPEFRLIDLGLEAEPSPVKALNTGIAAGRGDAFALMIDGAHVLTPGVLHFGLAGLRTYRPAIVATQQWYIGPGQQGDAMDEGYDQAYEDRLFGRIRWPQAGYRLFEISHFVGDRDWFDGLWESNCMFVERAQIDQLGGFDDSFSAPGGGYANLELYERLGSSADVTVSTILGEGSFHQLHGGTTTNQVDPAERRARVFGYSQDYAALRGRPFRGPGKPIHFVGRINSQAAKRTKPRRLSAPAFSEAAAPGGIDGLPTEPTPVPDELKWAFTDAVWRSLPWSRTQWLGEAVGTAPTDLLAYQELISTVRPDWVVETGTADGGRTLFIASVCDLVGHGAVISIGDPTSDPPPQHPRITRVEGVPRHQDIAEQVRRMVGDGRALVILGSRAHRTDTVDEFEAYAPLVPAGSYVVVADTVVNGHPAWTGFGPGPAEAVKQILAKHGDFAIDPAMEKYSFTFNPNGFLRKVR